MKLTKNKKETLNNNTELRVRVERKHHYERTLSVISIVAICEI